MRRFERMKNGGTKMDYKESKNLNITFKNDEADQEVIVTFGGIFQKLRKYFVLWFAVAAIAGVLMLVSGIISKNSPKTPVSGLVSFTYKGVEKGKAPDGSKFDYNSLRSPAVITDALKELNYPEKMVAGVRAGIQIEGVIPADAIDRITTYKSVYENVTSGALSAAQAMLDVTYYPTQYELKFNYADLGISRAEAANILNTMMECYRDYFFEEYGFNEALGSSVAALDYTNYDYAEAIDMFDDTLSTMSSYVSSLSSEDTSRFRSTKTGYTFADLKKAIASIREMDLDILSSYITVNNVTRDKDRLVAYYQYRIDNLTRSQTVYEEELATITESIAQYEKDQIIVFSDGTEGMNTQFTEASDQYDKMVAQKISVQSELSSTKQRIVYYQERIRSLKSKLVGSTDKVQKVEDELVLLNEKVDKMITLVNDTADDYYENESLAGTYNVLVPATASVAATSFSAVKSIIIPAFIVEALIVVLYLCVVLFEAIKEQHLVNRKKKLAAEGVWTDDESEDGEDDDDDEKTVVLSKKEKREKSSKKDS